MPTPLLLDLDDFKVFVGDFEICSHFIEGLQSNGLNSQSSFALGEMKP
jgi:hypothetical protein